MDRQVIGMSSDAPLPAATVVMTTKNRKEDLLRAARSVVAQSVPVELLVFDDGSTDGSPDAFAAEFPDIFLHRSPESVGTLPWLNEGFRRARAPIVITMDDDAEFSTPTVVEDTLREFDDPRIGVVAMPFVDVRISDAVKSRAPEGDGGPWVSHHFTGTAGALRRDVFEQIGGFNRALVHMSWESDFCIRALAAGYVVRLGGAAPIWHYQSLVRSWERADMMGRRGDVLLAWWYTPAWRLPLRLLGVVGKGLRHGVRIGRTWNMVRGLARGFGAMWPTRKNRQPLSPALYALYRELRTTDATPLRAIEGRLPPLKSTGVPATCA